MEFYVGIIIVAGLMFMAGAAVNGIEEARHNTAIQNVCQGKPWVIEEPLIKKTLTCVVEIKEKK